MFSVCTVQYGSHGLYVAIAPWKCDSCDEGAEYKILLNSELNNYMWLAATMLDSTNLDDQNLAPTRPSVFLRLHRSDIWIISVA